MISLSNIEFYNTPEGEIVVKHVNDKSYVLSEKHRDVISQTIEMIQSVYPRAYDVLKNYYERYSGNRIHYEFLIVSRFIRCNFGMYDTEKIDVDSSGVMHVEQVKCPLRGTEDCAFCNIVCMPEPYKMFTDHEMVILGMMAAGMTNHEIADRLGISHYTVIRHRNIMRRKAGVKNSPQLINFYKSYYK